MGGTAVTITPPSWRTVATERLVTCPRTQSRSGEKQQHRLLTPEPKLQGFLTLEWKVQTYGKSLNNLGTLRSPLVNPCSRQAALCTRMSAWLEIVQAALNMSCFTHRRIWLITEYPLPNQMSYAGSNGITHRFHMDYWKGRVKSSLLPFSVTLPSEWWNTAMSWLVSLTPSCVRKTFSWVL